MENRMIRDIAQEELFQYFYRLAAEVDCGNHFDFSNPQHDKWLRKHIALDYYRGARFFAIFLEDSSPVGYGSLLIDEKLEGVALTGQKSELLDIGVLDEFRGKGYGKKLLSHAESVSRESGVYCMYIKTYAKDYKVVAFYGSSGFVPVATLPDVYGPGDEGDIYMRKILR
jgi:ribosomal protein S18 acetylase RimI-like enzyme